MLARTVANVKGRAVQKLQSHSLRQLVSTRERVEWLVTDRLQVHTPDAIQGALPASCQCCAILAV